MPRCVRACVCVCVCKRAARLLLSHNLCPFLLAVETKREGRWWKPHNQRSVWRSNRAAPWSTRRCVPRVNCHCPFSFPHFYTHSRPLKTAAYCPWRNNTGPVLYNAIVQEGKRSLTVPPTCVRALLSGPADRDGRTKSTIQTPAASPRQGLDTTTPNWTRYTDSPRYAAFSGSAT